MKNSQRTSFGASAAGLWTLALLAGSAISLAPASAVDRAFVVVDLGTLGGTESAANDISDQFQIVGSSRVATGDFHAFVQSNSVDVGNTGWVDYGGMTDLGTSSGGNYTVLNRINNHGQAVGCDAWGIPTPISIGAYLDPASGAWGIVDLGVFTGGAFKKGNGLNDRGDLVGTGEKTIGGIAFNRPMFIPDWNMTPTDLATFGGGNFGEAAAVNYGRVVVGRAGSGPTTFRAASWTYAATTNTWSFKDLDPQGLFGLSWATGINDGGQIIGAFQKNGVQHAFWMKSKGSAMVDIDAFGSVQSSANDINARGAIAGDYMLAGGPSNGFFYWPDIGHAVDVNTLTAGSPWRIESLRGINRYDVMVGTGLNPAVSPDPHAVVVLPVKVKSLKSSPSKVAGGLSAAGTVTLYVPAPRDMSVELTSSSSLVTLPAVQKVVSGGTSATFTMATKPVLVETPVTITANLVGIDLKTIKLVVRPIGVRSVTLTPTKVVGGGQVAGIVELETKPDNVVGPITVQLASSNPSVAQPTNTSITIPVGETKGSFQVQTSMVAASTYVTISATANGIKKSRTLQVVP